MNYWDGEHWFYNYDQAANAPANRRGNVCPKYAGGIRWKWRGLSRPSNDPRSEGK